MLAKRIIPCLDIKAGRVVKGTNFINLKDAGDPISLARHYAEIGADELVFLDITATLEKRKTLVTLVKEIGKVIDIPFTVGGGISDVDLVDELLQNGADKITINSAAVYNPGLINEVSDKYGAQCLVAAIDAKSIGEDWSVYTRGGTKQTNLDLFNWAKELVDRGAGEILFTSMNADGSKKGFEINGLKRLSEFINVPIIASGGAGCINDFVELFSKTKVTGGLAASIFHFGEVAIPNLKQELYNNGIPIRLN
ncbi:MAG: cyclase [Saprospiraceae bacterium]|jgi:cyclase|tara:strand:+ start:1723 stop:2481 length:759 start_codon:yes stop_codon:yes gene_type:complete